MKKYFIIVATVLCLISPAFAAQSQELSAATLAKLSSTEQKQILSLISNSSKTDVNELTKYAELGTVIGKALAGSARELGVAVNDFAKTDVGYLATVLIVWHFLGEDILHFTIALFILLIGLTVLWVLLDSQRGGSYQTINNKQQFVKGELTSDETVWYFIGLVILLIISGVIATV